MTGYYDKDGDRKVPYKEDSTKGSSLIQPLNYKGDVLTQAWVDSRVLATLSNWLDSKGFYARSMSEVARRPLEVLMEHLVETGQVNVVDDTVVARELLAKRYRVKLNRGGRGGKNVLHNQVLSEQRAELADKVERGSKFNDAQMPQSRKRLPTAEEIARAVEIYHKLEEAERNQSKEEAVSNARESGMIVEDKS